jgi:hypothetical protein
LSIWYTVLPHFSHFSFVVLLSRDSVPLALTLASPPPPATAAFLGSVGGASALVSAVAACLRTELGDVGVTDVVDVDVVAVESSVLLAAPRSLFVNEENAPDSFDGVLAGAVDAAAAAVVTGVDDDDEDVDDDDALVLVVCDSSFSAFCLAKNASLPCLS